MSQQQPLVRARMRTPRAAAIAGIVFSVLLMLSLGLIRAAVPADPHDQGAWLSQNWRGVQLGLNLVPFAGIAFLWFIGVVRDRLGDREDRFFATIFLGSGLLFLAMMFASAALSGGLMEVFRAQPSGSVPSEAYLFGRAAAFVIMNTYAMRMAGVFMITTCTLFIRTGVMPRWMAWLGFALALFLVLGPTFNGWSALMFPAWVLIVSLYMLVEEFRGGAVRARPAGTEGAQGLGP